MRAHAGAVRRRVDRPGMDRTMMWIGAAPVFVFLLLPSLIVVPMALTPTDTLEFPPSGFSLHTFGDFFSDEQWTSAASTSLFVGMIVVVLATIAGTLAAIGLHRARLRGRGLVIGLVLLPMVVPVVVLALADFAFLAHWKLIGSPVGIRTGA